MFRLHATRNTLRFSSGFHCAPCNLNYREPSPALFSFNHPLGACRTCKGFGRTIAIDYDLAIPDLAMANLSSSIDPGSIDRNLQALSGVTQSWQFPDLPDQVKLDLVGTWE